MKRVLALAFLAAAGLPAYGQQVNITENSFYFGAGLSSNDYEGFGDRSFGFQVLGGLDIIRLARDRVTVGAELGYLDAGEVDHRGARADAEGVWANGVVGYAVNPKVSLLGRAGLDFGDDDGPMFGFGAGYRLDRNLQFRGEVVIREHIDSLQANFVYHL